MAVAQLSQEPIVNELKFFEKVRRLGRNFPAPVRNPLNSTHYRAHFLPADAFIKHLTDKPNMVIYSTNVNTPDAHRDLLARFDNALRGELSEYNDISQVDLRALNPIQIDDPDFQDALLTLISNNAIKGAALDNLISYCLVKHQFNQHAPQNQNDAPAPSPLHLGAVKSLLTALSEGGVPLSVKAQKNFLHTAHYLIDLRRTAQDTQTWFVAQKNTLENQITQAIGKIDAKRERLGLNQDVVTHNRYLEMLDNQLRQITIKLHDVHSTHQARVEGGEAKKQALKDSVQLLRDREILQHNHKLLTQKIRAGQATPQEAQELEGVERDLKQLDARYHTLPETDRQKAKAYLNELAPLERAQHAINKTKQTAAQDRDETTERLDEKADDLTEQKEQLQALRGMLQNVRNPFAMTDDHITGIAKLKHIEVALNETLTTTQQGQAHLDPITKRVQSILNAVRLCNGIFSVNHEPNAQQTDHLLLAPQPADFGEEAAKTQPIQEYCALIQNTNALLKQLEFYEGLGEMNLEGCAPFQEDVLYIISQIDRNLTQLSQLLDTTNTMRLTGIKLDAQRNAAHALEQLLMQNRNITQLTLALRELQKKVNESLRSESDNAKSHHESANLPPIAVLPYHAKPSDPLPIGPGYYTASVKVQDGFSTKAKGVIKQVPAGTQSEHAACLAEFLKQNPDCRGYIFNWKDKDRLQHAYERNSGIYTFLKILFTHSSDKNGFSVAFSDSSQTERYAQFMIQHKDKFFTRAHVQTNNRENNQNQVGFRADPLQQENAPPGQNQGPDIRPQGLPELN